MQSPAVWLILGVEPDVGTLAVAEGLIAALRKTGAPAVGVKPIDVGCPHAEDHDLRSPDGERLWMASQQSLPPLVVAPYRFAAGPDPVAAAVASGLDLTVRDLLSTIEDAAQFGGPVVVVGPPRAEGPFASDGDAWDLARAAKAHVVVVVDEPHRDALAPLKARAKQDNLPVVAVSRTAGPIDGAIHLPPAVVDVDDVAARLSSLVDA